MAEDTSFTHYNTVMDITSWMSGVNAVSRNQDKHSLTRSLCSCWYFFFHLTSLTKHTIKYENNCCNIVGISIENSARNRNMTRPDIPLFGMRLKDLIFYCIDPCSTMLFAVLFTITRKWNYDKCSSEDE